MPKNHLDLSTVLFTATGASIFSIIQRSLLDNAHSTNSSLEMEKRAFLPPQPQSEGSSSERTSFHDETDSVDYSAAVPQKRKARRSGMWAIAGKLAFIPLAVGIFYLGRITHDMTPARPAEPVSLGKCSPDWKESKARGCVYDFMLSTWMHPKCFNEEMHEKYLGYMKWRNTTYWYERERINEVPFDVAASGEHGEIFTDGTIHHMHCSYVWDRITYASHFKPRVLDSLCRDPKHVEHCILYNGIPQSWEIDLPNITRVYNEPHEVDCLVG
ncbi:hypothetical protein CABS01_00888 [Colletotrichum abscissum]|uniref:uncharacterized protein n=1 Tax=Colletotrichum abscissum TaxID=1671311 RepID=UPI0027D5D145|nr:uncharacterized protein CABS01_00888 [Colletotrichum abscissum]KAK1505420.1 hypothetical protein CABS01_00888 [Colletotrichum abscissum]